MRARRRRCRRGVDRKYVRRERRGGRPPRRRPVSASGRTCAVQQRSPSLGASLIGLSSFFSALAAGTAPRERASPSPSSASGDRGGARSPEAQPIPWKGCTDKCLCCRAAAGARSAPTPECPVAANEPARHQAHHGVVRSGPVRGVRQHDVELELSSSSAGMRVCDRRPNPVLMPYAGHSRRRCSPRWRRSAPWRALPGPARAAAHRARRRSPATTDFLARRITRTAGEARARAQACLVSASAWRMTLAGSFHSTRSMRRAAAVAPRHDTASVLR